MIPGAVKKWCKSDFARYVNQDTSEKAGSASCQRPRTRTRPPLPAATRSARRDEREP